LERSSKNVKISIYDQSL